MLHIFRNSSSFLKKLGISPNRRLINSVADMGLPSGLQKVVFTMLSSSRSLLSDNLTLIIFLGGYSPVQGSFPQTGQGSAGSLSQTQGRWPQTLQGFSPVPSLGSGLIGSPSHSWS